MPDLEHKSPTVMLQGKMLQQSPYSHTFAACLMIRRALDETLVAEASQEM